MVEGADVMQWEKDNGRYAWGSILRLGKWPVGRTGNDASVGKDDPRKWGAHCRLPGIKETIGFYETEEEAKGVVEHAVKHWIKNSGIAPHIEEPPQ